MKGKLIILIGIIFLLSGCTVQYNAYFDDDKVIETMLTKGSEYTPIYTPAYITDQGASEENIKIEGINYYNMQANGDEVSYNFQFPFSQFSNSTIANTCLDSFTIDKVYNGEYLLNTSSYFSCLDYYTLVDDVTINLTFNNDFYEIKNTNADMTNGNTYAWHVNRDNYHDKNIQVTFKLKKENQQTQNSSNNNPTNPVIEKNKYLIFILAFIILIIVIIVVSYLKKGNYNKEKEE